MSELPFKNLRVINFGWVWAAPVLAHTLADMGAEVIKIESHKRPDIIRVLPPLLQEKPLESLYAHATLRNNYGVTLDLAAPLGQAIAKDLVKTADVVIENFTPRVMPRYGLGYRDLRKIRPDIVMISMSAAGQDGPLAGITTYGAIISCLAGLDRHQGYIGREKPVRFGITVPDPLMGILGAFVVMAALRHRAKTGRGQYIDLSQWEACTALLGGPIMDYILNRRIQYPRGNRDEMMAPHGAYLCKGIDAWVAIAVKTDEEWQRLAGAMGRPDLAQDERYADVYARQTHHDELDTLISRWTQRHTPMQVTRKLQRLGIAAVPSFSDKDTFEDPHYNARNDWVKVNHSQMGVEETIYGIPWKFSKTPGSIRKPAPSLGEDNRHVYGQLLGMPLPQVESLEKEKVFY
jgi:benzylsuccinate CoA-transferase BbsF subunit